MRTDNDPDNMTDNMTDDSPTDRNMKGAVDIGVNWVQWLRDRAARHYIWDQAAQYHRVVNLNPPCPHDPAAAMQDAWAKIPRVLAAYPHLRQNVFLRDLEILPPRIRARVNDFFQSAGLQDFEFLGAGGRAFAYRALHAPTGQYRIARLEGQHNGRKPRPDHPVVLQPFHSNQHNEHHHGGLKLEILPELVPLNKAFQACAMPAVPLLAAAFYRAAVDLGWGTNLMYGPDMYDRDAEFQNIGIRPDGKLVSFDPEIVTGDKAHSRAQKTPKLLRDASAQQLLLIYPGFR